MGDRFRFRASPQNNSAYNGGVRSTPCFAIEAVLVLSTSTQMCQAAANH